MNKHIKYAPHKFEAYGEEEIQAVVDCLRDGWLTEYGGTRVKEFEERVAKLFGKKYGIFVNSGSSACLLALACLELEKGSEVITPAATFSTTVAPIIQLGLKPVFVDVGLDTYVPEYWDIVQAVTLKTKAIMIPNLIGNKPSWAGLRAALNIKGREDIILIEDSADTITYTAESDISTTSFYASHVITAGGSGGMIMFNNKQLRDKALQFRDWGRIGDNSEIMADRFNHIVDGIPYDHKFLYGVLGYNFKSSEMNAAFGLVQLDKLEKFLQVRRNNIERYLENLKDVKEIILPNDSIKPNWLAIPLQINPEYTDKTRMELLTYLEENNIQTRVTFSGNITRHPVYREYLQEFKNSDLIMANSFLLGSHHGMTEQDVDYVTNKIKQFFNK
jgi:CDP-6-deoxy-D-xylo-4-hexulose-3-dehydrase